MKRVNVFRDKTDANCSKVRRHLIYSDVYTDSENDDINLPEPIAMSKLEASDIHSGMFVLVDLLTEKKNTSTRKSSYIAICQSDVDNEDDVQVMFLKAVGNDKKKIIPDENDVAFVQLHQIICKLTISNTKIRGNRLVYEFNTAVVGIAT